MSDAADLQIVAGSPTDEETAAIAAVFTQLMLERAASAQVIAQQPPRSLWARTMRPVRDPAAVDRGWR